MWPQSSPQPSESWVLSSEELALLRLSVEGLLLGLLPLQQRTSLELSVTTSKEEILRQSHKLAAFLNTPSSTYTLTRSSKRSVPSTPTRSSPNPDTGEVDIPGKEPSSPLRARR